MKRVVLPFMAVIVALIASVAGAAPQTPVGKPDVWIMPSPWPDGRCFRELFSQPDKWKETRSRTDALAYWSSLLDEQFKDDELRGMFNAIRDWRMRFALEVQVIKEYQPTGAQSFDISRKQWKRFQALGGDFDAIAMDEPLFCVRHVIKKDDSYAVKETADYVEKARTWYPNLTIGDIEPFPAMRYSDLVKWIDELNAELARRGVRGLDFLRIDADWTLFVKPDGGSWNDVKQIEDYCRSKGIKFSMIYWGSECVYLDQKGQADERTWYVSIMRQAYDYIIAGGKPDEYVIESWLAVPKTSVPETSIDTFTGSALDFIRRIVDKAR